MSKRVHNCIAINGGPSKCVGKHRYTDQADKPIPNRRGNSWINLLDGRQLWGSNRPSNGRSRGRICSNAEGRTIRTAYQPTHYTGWVSSWKDDTMGGVCA